MLKGMFTREDIENLKLDYKTLSIGRGGKLKKIQADLVNFLIKRVNSPEEEEWLLEPGDKTITIGFTVDDRD